MRAVPIRFDQGINLGSSPDGLKPGELRLGRNSYYRPESIDLRKIWGRSLFGAFGSAGIAALEFIQFRSAGAFLVGAAGTTLATATVGASGSWTTRKTLASAAGRAECAYYNGSDRAYWFDGLNTPQVWTGTGNTRDLGLLTPSAPILSLVANAATLYRIGTTFQYAFTEYDPTFDIESASSVVVVTASTGTGDTFKLTLPSRTNTVTKFRVYRTQDGGSVFYLLAEIDSQTVTSYYYDGTNTDAGAPAATNNDMWGFDSVDDIFLSTRPTLPMVGSPLAGNYITVNGTIPNGDIIAMFENSLLVAGIPTFPQDIYYSQPDKPEQFSPVHFLREENARGDAVTGMGVANDRLLAFTLNSIFRHDTLPRVTDPGFGVGLASRQLVTDDHGCVAKRSIVNFGVGAPNNRLFYLSSRGPFMTDGYQSIPLGQDLNWDSSIVNFAAMNLSIARAFPKYFVIVLMVPSASSLTNDIAFIYHYHPFHMKENGLGKWTGPIHLRAGAATVAHQINTETRFYTGDTAATGNVYLEDQGSTDDSLYENADGRINWEAETGDQNLGSETARKRVGRVFLALQGTDDTAPTVDYALSKRDQVRPVTMTNISTQTKAGTEMIGTSTVTRSKSRTFRGGIWNSGTHVRVKVSENVAGADRVISSIEAEVESWGKQI
jgi:hypothetical protein